MLPKLLHSLNSQTLLPQRVILIDDGSNDSPCEYSEEWKKANSPQFILDYIKHPYTRGVSAARNSGIKALGKCDFVYFLDSDDLPSKSFLEKTSQILATDPNMVAVNSNRIIVYGDEYLYTDISQLSHNLWEWILVNGAGIASCTLLRIEAVKKVGFFNTSLTSGEDIEFFSQIALLGKWGFTNDCYIEYSRHTNIEHLSNTHKDYLRLWVLTYENCIENLGTRKFINPKVLKNEMALRWRSAGEGLFIERRYNEATECFHHSIRWRILKNISWLYLLILYLLPTRFIKKI